MEFMTVPETYYQQLREKLKLSKVKIAEDLSILEVRHYFHFHKITRRLNDAEISSSEISFSFTLLKGQSTQK